MFRQLPKNERQFLLLILSEALCIPVGLVLYALNRPGLAMLLLPLVLLAWVLYVVFFDSKSRWPGASAFQRYANLITFKR